MGTPTPPPPIAGDNCALCFAAGETPLFLSVQVTGIEPCPPALHDMPNGFYTLKQKDIDPCTWHYTDDWHEMQLEYSDGHSGFWIRDVDDNALQYFWGATAVNCDVYFDNDHVACTGYPVAGKHGSVILL